MADIITEKGVAEKVAAVKDATGFTTGLVSVPDNLVPDTQTDPDHELTQILPFPDEVCEGVQEQTAHTQLHV